MRLALGIVLSAGLMPAAAPAGPFSDQLAACLVANTSAADKEVLMRWIVMAYSKHPAVAPLVVADPAAEPGVQEGVAHLFETLLVETCNTEARAAMQNEGNAAIEVAFNFFGQVAGRELMNDAAVGGFVQGFFAYVDGPRLETALGLR